MKNPLRALLVEDSEDDTVLMVHELRRNGYDLIYERVETAVDMMTALREKDWDIILSDYSMPNFSAPAALKVVQESGLDLPLIIVSGTIGEDAAVDAMKAGANDFFSKAKLVRLVPAIERELREAEERRKSRWVEKQLLQSEERFGKAFHASPTAISVNTVDGRFLDVNEQFLLLFGYHQGEVIGHTLPELLIWDDSVDRVQIEHILATQDSVRDLDVKCRTHSGDVRDVQVSFEGIELGGEPCVLILFHDVTARKQVQEELTALYNATSYLFNADSLLNLGRQIVQAVIHEFKQADCGLMLVDNQQNEMLRLARAGQHRIATDAHLYLDGMGLVAEAVKTGKIVYAPDVIHDTRYVSNDSQTQSELVIPLKTPKGVLGVLDLQSVDLNAFDERDQRILAAFAERAAAAIESMQLYEEINRHAAELEERVAQRTKEFQLAKEHVETILNNSSDAIILVSPDGSIQQTNRAFTQLFGYQGDDIFRKPITNLVVSDQADTLTHSLQMVIDGEQPPRIDLVAQHQAGTIFNAEIAFASMTQYQEHQIRIICSVRDVTQRTQTEEGLRKALEQEKELNELKSRFISMVSHEFRTPLATIQSSTDLIIRYEDRMTSERKGERLTNILLQVTRLTGLLDEVLTLSKAEAIGVDFHPVTIELETFCRNMVEDTQLIAPEQSIDFYIDQEKCREIFADPRLLGQAISNLLSNAVKYSPDKQTVSFHVSCEDPMVIFRVTDKGIGIPEEDRKYLFEVFHRASNVGTIPGTGLGLAIVKQAVVAHQGSITFDTELGIGTTFYLSIPIESP